MYRPDLSIRLMMNGGSIELDAINQDGMLSPRGYSPSYPWQNIQQVFPAQQFENFMFSGFGSSVSLDTLSVTLNEGCLPHHWIKYQV